MGEGFQIFISLPTDDVCTIRGLSEDNRIYQLKSRVELKTGIPGDIQHLYFMNKELHDTSTLADFKLKTGCIVRVKLESTWLDLFEACWRGDIYEVFQNGVQFLDEREFQGYNIALWNRIVIQRATSALFITSHRGYLGLILELLNHGAADINGKTRFGRTSLHVAAYQGFVGCVSLLLSEGALCNQVDYNGQTPLALASENGHICCEKRLCLYQMSLKALGGLSRNSSPDSRTRSETSESVNGRTHSRTSSKLLRPVANKVLLKEAEEKLEKKIEVHLPSVQTSDDRHNPSYKPVPDQKEQASRIPFSLVQIADKYRKEFKDSNNSNLPNMGDKSGNTRPHTAPVPTRPNNDEQKTGPRNELEMVEEANAVGIEKDKVNAVDVQKSKDSLDSLPATVTKETKPEGSTVSVSPRVSSLATMEKLDNQKERPQSSRPSPLRHLDVVISSTHKEHQTMKPEPSLSRDLPSPSDEPAIYKEFVDVSEHAYRPRRSSQTYDDWLEKKRSQGQLRPVTAPAPERSKMGKSIDPDVFKDWVNKKKRSNHYRSNSESSSNGPRKTYISSGLTFERWLDEKKKSASKESDNHVMESHDSGKRTRVILAGKTYEDWLNEKFKQAQSTNKSEEENKKGGPKSGKTFQMWLLEKHHQTQIEIIHKATEEKEKQRQSQLEQYQKYLNPNCRSFDEWLAIKKEEHLLERVRVENEPKEKELSSEEKKKDANLVFEIWLTMKVVQEIKEEEKKYSEMKDKWEKKENQRAALRRAIHMNRLMRKQGENRRTLNEEGCKTLSNSWS